MRNLRASGAWGLLIALALFVASLAATSADSPASASPNPGGIGVRLIADASSSPAEPLGLAYIVERIAPGSRIIRQVEISNTTDAMADIVVFPAAAGIVAGKFSFAPGRTRNPLSSWTSVALSVLHLGPGATALDAVTINVPRRASSWERYAVVWAEVSAASPAQSGVRLVNRVGVRMYVSVGKGGMPAAEFTVGSLAASRAENGDPLVVAKVHNVGEAALDITGELTLSDGPGRLSAGPFPIAVGTMLAPSHSAIERVEFDSQIPRGPWRAVLTLSSNGTQRRSVATITFPPETLANGERSLRGPLMLAALIVLMLLLAAASSVLFSRRHHLRLA
ncbi:MAG: hypothetical protein JWO62_35 [Acidimicrobiaceae bacterium]|nr:hypothetical protein [Acidimicrobiaceae bacterium]